MSGCAITGLGALCGVGDSASALFAGLLDGQTAARHLPALMGLPLDVGPLVATKLPEESAADGEALLSFQPRAGVRMPRCTAGRARKRSSQALTLGKSFQPTTSAAM